MRGIAYRCLLLITLSAPTMVPSVDTTMALPFPSCLATFPVPSEATRAPSYPTSRPPFLCRKQYEWGIDFYIRIDNAGYYHAYPYVGGPFQNLQETEHAIERYLHDRRDPKM